MTTLEKPPARRRDRSVLRGAGRLLPFLLLVAACWTSLLTLASPVSSEAPVLVSSVPGNGQVTRPDNIVLTFDRPVPAGLSTIRMTDPYRRPVDPGRPVHADGRDNTISVPVPKQKYAGTYSVAWSVPVTGQEAVTGTFTFDLASRSPVQEPPALDARPGAAVTVAHAVAQFLAFAALALLAGGVLFIAVVWPDGAESTVVRRVVGWAWGGLLGGTVLSLLTFGPYVAKLPLTDVLNGGLLSGVLESGTGHVYLARLLVVAVAGIGIAQFMTMSPADSPRERRLRGGTVLACAAAVAATWSFTGPGSVVVGVVHLTALAVLTGLLVMLYRVVPGERAAGRPETASRSAALIAVAVGVLVVTSGAQIWSQIGNLGSLRTRSGWLWAGFTVLVLVLGVLTLIRRPGGRLLPLGRAGIATVLVGVTAALAVAPAVASVGGPQAPLIRVQFDIGGATGQGELDVAIVPAKVGPNRVYVTVLDEANAAKTDASVFAELALQGTRVPVSFEPAEPGRLAGSVTVPSAGQWELALTVRATSGEQGVIYGVIDVR